MKTKNKIIKRYLDTQIVYDKLYFSYTKEMLIKYYNKFGTSDILFTDCLTFFKFDLTFEEKVIEKIKETFNVNKIKTDCVLSENLIIKKQESNKFEKHLLDSYNRIIIDYNNSKVWLTIKNDGMNSYIYLFIPYKLKNSFIKDFTNVLDIIADKSIEEEIKNAKDSLYLIAHSHNRGLYLNRFKIDKPVNEIPYELLYPNESKDNTYQIMINNLINNNNGIYILYGEPGGGKTSFIKKLISDEKLSQKKIIYAPFEILSKISNSDFIDFIIKEFDNENKKIIFICEDCEKLLRKRSLGNEASSILNFSDGILNSLINCQFIFTHNIANNNEIDEAFLRAGRLHMNHQFKKLEYEQWKKIIDYVDVENNIIIDNNEDKTLAEIFEIIKLNKNAEYKILKCNSDTNDNLVGFKRGKIASSIKI